MAEYFIYTRSHMKKLFNSVSVLLSRLLAGSLVLFGFGCSSSDDEPDTPMMYGTPTGTFEVKGSVTASDGQSSSPVESNIIVTYPDAPSSKYKIDEVKNTEDGQYAITGYINTNKIKVVCLPVDPAYEPDSTVVEGKFEKVNGKRELFMDMGHATFDVDFELKEKKAEE